MLLEQKINKKSGGCNINKYRFFIFHNNISEKELV